MFKQSVNAVGIFRYRGKKKSWLAWSFIVINRKVCSAELE